MIYVHECDLMLSFISLNFSYLIFIISRCFEKGICLLQELENLIEDWLGEKLKLGLAFKEKICSLNHLNLVSIFLSV